MFIARWIVEVRFGQKDAFLSLLHRFDSEIMASLGVEKSSVRWLNASIGAPESRYEEEMQVNSLLELEEFWAKVGQSSAYAALAQELAPLIIPGSNRWEIYRVVNL
ncbi:MAG TPA: hypothetical protein V6D23_14045 [Candidatus Obscuribacterales bacterium]